MNANPIGLIVMGIAALVAVVTVVIKKYNEWGAALTFVLGPLGLIINLVMTIKRYWDSICDAFSNGGFIEGIKQIGKALLDVLLYPIQQLLELLSKIPKVGGYFKDALQSMQTFRADFGMIDPKKETETDTQMRGTDDPVVKQMMDEINGTNQIVVPGTDGIVPGGGTTGGADAVAGSAKQIKNITVNIDAFNKGGINAGNTQGLNGMSATDIEEWFTQMLLRTIRNLETSY